MGAVDSILVSTYFVSPVPEQSVREVRNIFGDEKENTRTSENDIEERNQAVRATTVTRLIVEEENQWPDSFTWYR